MEEIERPAGRPLQERLSESFARAGSSQVFGLSFVHVDNAEVHTQARSVQFTFNHWFSI